MPNKNISTLRENLIADGYELPDLQTFEKQLSDSTTRNTFWSNLKADGYELPDFKVFSEELGIKPQQQPTLKIFSDPKLIKKPSEPKVTQQYYVKTPEMEAKLGVKEVTDEDLDYIVSSFAEDAQKGIGFQDKFYDKNSTDGINHQFSDKWIDLKLDRVGYSATSFGLSPGDRARIKERWSEWLKNTNNDPFQYKAMQQKIAKMQSGVQKSMALSVLPPDQRQEAEKELESLYTRKPTIPADIKDQYKRIVDYVPELLIHNGKINRNELAAMNEYFIENPSEYTRFSSGTMNEGKALEFARLALQRKASLSEAKAQAYKDRGVYLEINNITQAVTEANDIQLKINSLAKDIEASQPRQLTPEEKAEYDRYKSEFYIADKEYSLKKKDFDPLMQQSKPIIERLNALNPVVSRINAELNSAAKVYQDLEASLMPVLNELKSLQPSAEAGDANSLKRYNDLYNQNRSALQSYSAAIGDYQQKLNQAKSNPEYNEYFSLQNQNKQLLSTFGQAEESLIQAQTYRNSQANKLNKFSNSPEENSYIASYQEKVAKYEKLVQDLKERHSKIEALTKKLGGPDVLNDAISALDDYNNLSVFEENYKTTKTGIEEQRVTQEKIDLVNEYPFLGGIANSIAALGGGITNTLLDAASGVLTLSSDFWTPISNAVLGTKIQDYSGLDVIADTFKKGFDLSGNYWMDDLVPRLKKSDFVDPETGEFVYTPLSIAIGTMETVGLMAANALLMSASGSALRAYGMTGVGATNLSTTAPMFFATYDNNKQLAKQLGYKGSDANLAAVIFSQLEAFSELISPDTRFFSGSNKNEVFKMFLDNYEKGGLKAATGRLFGQVKDELGEEFASMLGNNLATALTAAAGVGNKVDAITKEKIYETLLFTTTSVLTLGTMPFIKPKTYGRKFNSLALHEMAKDANNAIGFIKSYNELGKISDKKAEKLIQNVSILSSIQGTLPESLSENKKIVVGDLLVEKNNLLSLMSDPNVDEAIKLGYKNNIKSIDNQIAQVISTPDAEFNVQFSNELKAESEKIQQDLKENGFGLEELVVKPEVPIEEAAKAEVSQYIEEGFMQDLKQLFEETADGKAAIDMERRMQNAEEVPVPEINKVLDGLYRQLEIIMDKYYDKTGGKELAQALLDRIDKIKSYEFATNTEVAFVTETAPIQTARATVEKEVGIIQNARAPRATAQITTADGTTGTYSIEVDGSGNVTFEQKGVEPIQVGKLTDVNKSSRLVDAQFDENGMPSSITFTVKDSNGNDYTVSVKAKGRLNSEKLLDLAIGLRANEIGEVDPEAFDVAFNEVSKKQITTKTYAVQEQAAGQVPVQPETRAGEKVEEGKPQAEPQKLAKKGKEEEVKDRVKRIEKERVKELEALMVDMALENVKPLKGNYSLDKIIALIDKLRSQVKENPRYQSDIDKLEIIYDEAKKIKEKYDAQIASLKEKEPVEEVTEEKVVKTIPGIAKEIMDRINLAVSRITKFYENSPIGVIVIEDENEFDIAVQRQEGEGAAAGMFISYKNNGKSIGAIFINPKRIAEYAAGSEATVIWHEGIHPILNILRITNPQRYTAVVNAVLSLRSKNLAIRNIIDLINSNPNYNTEGVREDEYITEVLANIGTGRIKLESLPNDFRQTIVDFINSVARLIGFNGPILKNTDIGELKKLSTEIASAFKEGKSLADIVGTENVGLFTEGAAAIRLGKARQFAPNVKREEVKSSLINLREQGVLVSPDGKMKMSNNEIDAQMALMDAMAGVWESTTGRNDFYDVFIGTIQKGDPSILKKEGGLLFQDDKVKVSPISNVTLSVFYLPQFKQMEGKQVNPQSISDLMKSRGKQIEKNIITYVLGLDKYAGQKKISYDEFRSDVELFTMKLEKIYTSTYANYGSSNIEDTDDYGDAKTIILNSPLDHGEYGHFRNDFDKKNVLKTEWDIRKLGDSNTWVAVDKNMPPNLSPAQIQRYVGTAGTKEHVERWILDRKDLSESKDINIGLFGHIRRWLKDNIFHLVEMQSDFFQKEDVNRLILTKEDIAKIRNENEQWRADNYENALNKALAANNLYLDASKFNDGVIIIKNQFDEVLDEVQWPMLATQYKTVEKHESIINGILNNSRYQSGSDLGFFVGSLRSYSLDADRKYDERISQQQKEKVNEIKAKSADYLSQFAASEKVHEMRIFREAVKIAAEEGATIVRFPTPYTLALVEGYVSKNSSLPYEINTAQADGSLGVGDEIDYGGEKYTVIESDGNSFRAAPHDEVYLYSISEYIYNEVNDHYAYEAQNEFESLYPDGTVSREEHESASYYEWHLESALNDWFNNNDDPATWDNIEQLVIDSATDDLNSRDISDLFGWATHVSVDQSGDYAYGFGGRRSSIINFDQPDGYTSDSAEDTFDKSSLGKDQQTVIKKYEEFNDYLLKNRKDAKIIKDNNNVSWIEFPITEEDINNPVIAFQEEAGKVKGAIDLSLGSQANIYMFDGANISTLAHEMTGHVGQIFLKKLSELNADFKKDYDLVKEWAGVKGEYWSRPSHEKFARAFERYLREGKSPIKSLNNVFSRMAKWLSEIYKKITGSSIDVDLTPEVRMVFDRMLSGQGPIRQASPVMSGGSPVRLGQTTIKTGQPVNGVEDVIYSKFNGAVDIGGKVFFWKKSKQMDIGKIGFFVDVEKYGQADIDTAEEAMRIMVEYANRLGYAMAINNDDQFGIPKTKFSILLKKLGFIKTPKINEYGIKREWMKIPDPRTGPSDLTTAGFITRDGANIGFQYDTKLTARERFVIPALTEIAAGSDRTVFDLQDGTLLKIAKTARGLRQNIYEGDPYLVDNGILPKVIERGLNYVVVEKVSPYMDKPGSLPATDLMYKIDPQPGFEVIKSLILDLMPFAYMDYKKRDPRLRGVLAKYGLDAVMKDGYDLLWGDFAGYTKAENWGVKNGLPIHLDGGTFAGISFIDEFKKPGANLEDYDFAEVAKKSKEARIKFADTDTYRQFSPVTSKEASDLINMGESNAKRAKEMRQGVISKTSELITDTKETLFRKLRKLGDVGRTIEAYIHTIGNSATYANNYISENVDIIWQGLDNRKNISFTVQGTTDKYSQYSLFNAVLIAKRVIGITDKINDKFNRLLYLDSELKLENMMSNPNQQRIDDLKSEISIIKDYLNENNVLSEDADGNYVLNQRTFTQKMTKEKAIDFLNQLQLQHPELYSDFQFRADTIQSIYRELIQMQYKNGLINYNAMIDLNKYFYIPMKNIGYLLDDIMIKQEGGRQGKLVTDQLIQKLKAGSEEDISVDFQSLMMFFVAATFRKTQENDAAKQIAKLTYSNPNNGVFMIPTVVGADRYGNPKYAKYSPDLSEINYYEDGLKKSVLADSRLVNQYYSLNKSKSTYIDEVISNAMLTNVFKTITTGANPAFGLYQLVIDIPQAILASDAYSSAFAGTFSILAKDISLLYNSMKANNKAYMDLYHEAAQEGALATFTRLESQYDLLSLKEAESEGLMKKVRKTKYYEVSSNIGQTLESLTRLAIYDKYKKKLIKRYGGNPTADQMKDIKKLAAAEAANILNYNRGGILTKKLNNTLAYINVTFQAPYSIYRYAKRKPVQFILKVSEFIVYMNLLQYLPYLLLDDDDKERWKKLMNSRSEYERNNYIAIAMPGSDLTDPDKALFLRIPKPAFIRPLINMVENLVFGYIDKDLKSIPLQDSITDYSSMFVINPLNSVPLINAYMKYFQNKDLYRKREIVPRESEILNYTEGMEDENVGSAFKAIAELQNYSGFFSDDYTVSPKRFDAAFKAAIGDYTKNPVLSIPFGLFNQLLKLSIPQYKQIDETYSDADKKTIYDTVFDATLKPFTSRFVTRFSDIPEEYYKKMNENKKERNEFRYIVGNEIEKIYNTTEGNVQAFNDEIDILREELIQQNDGNENIDKQYINNTINKISKYQKNLKKFKDMPKWIKMIAFSENATEEFELFKLKTEGLPKKDIEEYLYMLRYNEVVSKSFRDKVYEYYDMDPKKARINFGLYKRLKNGEISESQYDKDKYEDIFE